MKAVLIPGDGIGPEISASVESITKAMNLDIEQVQNMQKKQVKYGNLVL